MKDLLLKNCRDLLTIRQDAKDLIGLEKNTCVLICNACIKAIDSYEQLRVDAANAPCEEIDCSQCVVMPGYVDCHTHLIFGESRVEEYVASLTMSAQQVKQVVARTGLDASIYATKRASDEQLIATSLEKLTRMLHSGTTTVEIKSGYGVDKDTELRQLRLIKQLAAKTPQTICSTYLGAHYYDVQMGKQPYIDFMIREVMPVIQAEGLAEFADVWIDEGYYTAQEAKQVLLAAKTFGMEPTMHTECYSAIGGAALAAQIGAANAGHLNFLKAEDIPALADAGVVGVLIPGTDFAVKHPKPFAPRAMIQGRMEIALATNLNPGNWIESMQLVMSLACRNHGLSANEAIRAATLGGAKALRLADEIGSIEVGKKADIQIVRTDHYQNCVYKMGVNEVEHVIKGGEIIF